MNDIDTVAQRLRPANRVVVLTGAGVSKESGIPTFRDALTGLWADFEPEKLATPQGFLADPPLVWQWYDSRRQSVTLAQPNPGHYAIARMEKLVPRLVTITQNVDGLHAKAGSTDVVELHGNILKFKCFNAGHPCESVPANLKEPPLCHCGSVIRPDVVWFGEPLPENALQRAFFAMEQADVVLVVGTSGLVQPAASLPFYAKRGGAYVVEVNPDETPISDIADCFLAGPSGEILPKLLDRLEKGEGA